MVLREVTERPEAVAAGTARVVGTDVDKVISAASLLLKDENAYNEMARYHIDIRNCLNPEQWADSGFTARLPGKA